jgi:hypothetical protein
MTDAGLLHLQPMEFACVETQIGNGEAADCEVIDLERECVVIQIA